MFTRISNDFFNFVYTVERIKRGDEENSPLTDGENGKLFKLIFKSI